MISVLALLLGGLLWGATADPQKKNFWTDLDGHHYDAAIVSLYNQELVTFRHPDGRTFTLALNDLVPNDREAVLAWLDRQSPGMGMEPPPTQALSPFGRIFVLDEPRVLRLRALQDHGYLSAYLGIPLTLRNTLGGVLDYVNVYFFDENHQRIGTDFPLIPRGNPIMIQNGKTTAFVKPAELKPGQTYMVLIPIRDPAVRMAAYDVVVAGNGPQNAAAVFPDGSSWRNFVFPERPLLLSDKYADYSGQELYPNQMPADLFAFDSVLRVQPASGDHTPERDYFRLALRIYQPFPAAALSARWYAFDKNRQLIHAEDTPPYAQADRKDGMFILNLSGQGPAELAEAVMPTKGDGLDSVQLPGAAWWDKPEVDSLVFVFGTETKKIARVFSKSGETLRDLPVPERETLAGANVDSQPKIPTRQL